MENNLVFNHEGIMVTSSRKVAEDFGKEHKNITRDIRGYLDFLISSKMSVSKYFIEGSYKDVMNREQSEYMLTKNGFSLVVMGFTGTEALMWKIEYINEFDRMENELKTIEESKNKEYLNFITELYGEVYNLETALSILKSHQVCNIETVEELLERYRAERWITENVITQSGLKGLYLVILDNEIYASQKAINKISRKCYNDNSKVAYSSAAPDGMLNKEISFKIKEK